MHDKYYDNNHNVTVDNKTMYSITYTPAKGTQSEDRLEVAETLAELISMDSEDDLEGITDRDKKEYWYIKDEDNKEEADERLENLDEEQDRKSTRLNSSHVAISYAVFCLKKKNYQQRLTH